MRGSRCRRGAVLAVALLSVVGLAGCEKIPPVLTVQQPTFPVGSQIGPSERIPDPYGDVITESTVPMILRWSATDNNTLCNPTFTGREAQDFSGDFTLFSDVHKNDLLVAGADYPEDGPAGRFYGWGITAHDCFDNHSMERIVGRRVVVVQENGLVASGVWHAPFTVQASPAGAWSEHEHVDHSGGEALTTTRPGASISFTYDFGPRAGRPVAVVTSDSPYAASRMEVLVDGQLAGSVGPWAGGRRTIAWSGSVPAGVHTVTVRKAADDGPSSLTVDAFVVADGLWGECGRLVCPE